MLTRAVVLVTRNIVRKCHNVPVKFTGQTPASFVHNGWANSRTPFHVTNKWTFLTKTLVICSIGFWAPFIVIDYQLRKARN
ncbi:hypothetical protein Q1695_010589 [Nippostrongylus brasiliensis]|nr:hypothetical protein Q1695_010589 [Nippostrongylus brasiliensis]